MFELMNAERLLKLADHLMTGQLGHAVFDFGQYNNVSAPTCGTAGCAIGECPIALSAITVEELLEELTLNETI